MIIEDGLKNLEDTGNVADIVEECNKVKQRQIRLELRRSHKVELALH